MIQVYLLNQLGLFLGKLLNHTAETIPTVASNKIGNNLLEVLKKHDSNVHKQPMPHTAPRNTTLFSTPVETPTSHPRTVAHWLLVVSEGLDHSSGLVCSGRLTNCTALQELLQCPALLSQWELLSRENFPSHLEKVRNHPESESRGGESPSKCHESAA